MYVVVVLIVYVDIVYVVCYRFGIVCVTDNSPDAIIERTKPLIQKIHF